MHQTDTLGDAKTFQDLFRLADPALSGNGPGLTSIDIEKLYHSALSYKAPARPAESADITGSRDARLRHWGALFASAKGGGMDALLAASVEAGREDGNDGHGTASYLAGYAALTEELVVGLLHASLTGRQREAALRAVLRCCFADMAATVAAPDASASQDDAQSRLMAMSDSLERELSTTLSEVHHQVLTLSQVASQLEQISGNVTAATGTVAASAQSTREGVSIVASASQELEASSQDITDQTAGAADKAETALADVAEAKRAMDQLTENAAAIGEVTDLVQRIAKQTRLLALNATIEAARAGDAGRGFAVVAGEVKSLATETETAIASVNDRTRRIEQSTQSVTVALGSIASGVEELSQRAGSISSSADEQRAAIAEIARSAERASQETGQVADEIIAVQDTAQVSLRAADRLSEISARLGRDVGDLQRRVTTMLRSSVVGDRRRLDRLPVGIPGTLSAGAGDQSGHTVDLSISGALFFPGLDEAATGREGELDIEGVGRLSVRVVASSPLGSHLQFLRPSEREIAQIEATLAATKQRDAPLVTLCTDAAAQLSRILSSALSSGRIDADALFDDDYVPIDGTDPQQFMTGYVTLTDAEFPAAQEPILSKDPAIVFCAAVDRNAFLPTHNATYSKPQKPGDPVWNTANCRNRRIFDDRAGLLAARNTDDFKVQSYVRDMGGGNRQVLKEVDCPIRVADRIWGNLRLAYRT